MRLHLDQWLCESPSLCGRMVLSQLLAWSSPFSNCSLPSEETITPAFSTLIATSSPRPSRNSSHSSLVSSIWNSNPLSIHQESKTDPCKSNTTIFYSNCRSLLHQLTDLHLLANSSSPPAIMALVETWLYDSVLDVELQLPAYNLYKRDRDRHGGGIAVYTVQLRPSEESCHPFWRGATLSTVSTEVQGAPSVCHLPPTRIRHQPVQPWKIYCIS